LAEAIARDGLGDSQVDDVAAVQHLLRQVPLFKRIGKRHLRLLAGRCHVIRYRPGEPIVRAGFSGEGFFTIAGGRARVERPDGHTVILAEGDCFGDLSLIDGASRNATVVAETDLIALKLTRQTFLDLLDAEPTVCRSLVESLVERIRAIEARSPA
jgi:CRP/FNR family transcriptional regulator, cyclic AMP receptor protein